jgi:hypothetical protein
MSCIGQNTKYPQHIADNPALLHRFMLEKTVNASFKILIKL